MHCLLTIRNQCFPCHFHAPVTVLFDQQFHGIVVLHHVYQITDHGLLRLGKI